MKKFAADHPVIFEIVLILAGFLLALGFSLAGQALYYPDDVNMALGRILAGCLLLLVFHRCFRLKKQLSGWLITLPALLFAVWNVVYHFLTNSGTEIYPEYAVILGLAPAVFEEVIFRGIFIHNLKANGRRPMEILLISALLFGVIHLTNLAGMAPVQALIQTGYAVIVGLVFGAIYIRSGDLVSVILAHAAVDISSRLFPGGQTTPIPLLAAFIILLAGEAVYAFRLLS